MFRKEGLEKLSYKVETPEKEYNGKHCTEGCNCYKIHKDWNCGDSEPTYTCLRYNYEVLRGINR